MSNLDLSDLTPEQEDVLKQAYRYIRQRAAYLRAQQAAASKDTPARPQPAQATRPAPGGKPE